jgi:hypothetical protein
MIQISQKSTVKSLTYTLHEQMKANPKMKVSQFREIFSKILGSKDWNALLGQFDDNFSPLSFNDQASIASADSVSKLDLNTGYCNNSLDLHMTSEDYDIDTHGTLESTIANALVELFYSSEFWYLAPCMDGVFNTKEQALNFIEKYPNYPLSIIMSTNNSQGSVSLLVNSKDGIIFFREECNYDVLDIGQYDNIHSLKRDITEIMTKRAKYDHDDKGSYAIPFIPKGHKLKDYVNSVDYYESEHGEVSVLVANKLIQFCEIHEQYSLGSIDGQPIGSKEDAEDFIKYFPNHPLILIVDLGYFNEKKEYLSFALDIHTFDSSESFSLSDREDMSLNAVVECSDVSVLEKDNFMRNILVDMGEIK